MKERQSYDDIEMRRSDGKNIKSIKPQLVAY